MTYSVFDGNRRLAQDAAAFIAAAEDNYNRQLDEIADYIAANRDTCPIVLISGPSGSGKTTTALMIEALLDARGIETHTISMDNYFNTVDPETAPRNRDGDIDFESPFFLDIGLLNRHFAMLDEGLTIHVPKYEFARQMRSDLLCQPLRLQENELALFEGIHALNDVFVGKNPKAFKLYIAARSNVADENGAVVFQSSWMRLCRRIVRDYKFRGSAADFTMKLWANVRRGEKLYIAPYRENANLKFDTSMAYEVCVMKPFAQSLLERLPRGVFPVADEILTALEKFETLDESYVPADSLLREFIGGSTYYGN